VVVFNVYLSLAREWAVPYMYLFAVQGSGSLMPHQYSNLARVDAGSGCVSMRSVEENAQDLRRLCSRQPRSNLLPTSTTHTARSTLSLKRLKKAAY
jgi:hypothetical protein